jgi:hypothetical protein
MKIYILTLLLCGSLFSQQAALAESESVTAAQVNGEWECKSGTFKILALGQQKLQIEFSGIHSYKLKDGSPMANTGEGSGIVLIEGRTAKFKPEGAEASACSRRSPARSLLGRRARNSAQNGIPLHWSCSPSHPPGWAANSLNGPEQVTSDRSNAISSPRGGNRNLLYTSYI